MASDRKLTIVSVSYTHLDVYKRQDVDTSLLSGDDYNAVVKMTVVMGAGTADMMFCGEETYKKYKQQEAFLSWKEVLGDDYSKYEEYMTDDGRLDLEKCPNWEKYNMVSVSYTHLFLQEIFSG